MDYKLLNEAMKLASGPCLALLALLEQQLRTGKHYTPAEIAQVIGAPAPKKAAKKAKK